MRDGSGIYTYPPGTPGVAGQTIFSARYNTFLDDLATTLNTKLPINMGGTNATDVAAARTSLQAERAQQSVTNYNTQVWENGSFWSNPGATAAPNPTDQFTGTVCVVNNDQNYVTVEARSLTSGISYLRKKVGGTWGGWTADSGTAAFVLKAGDTMTGSLFMSGASTIISSPAKGNLLGTPGGTAATGAVVPADANILLYQGSSANWAGIGVDNNGHTWFRVGTTGTPPPALYFDSSNQAAVFSGTVAVTSGAFKVYGYAGNTGQGVVFLNQALNRYLIYDVANARYELAGATLLVSGSINGYGFTCRPGYAGAAPGSTFNINWTGATGAHLYIDTTDMGQFSFVSDHRIKKDVVDLPGMWDTVKALRPIKYTQADYTPPPGPLPPPPEPLSPEPEGFIADDTPAPKPAGTPLFTADDIERWGFIAHELQETLIENAATGVKDDPACVQSPNPWTVIAALTRALQEAMTRIEALEARGV